MSVDGLAAVNYVTSGRQVNCGIWTGGFHHGHGELHDNKHLSCQEKISLPLLPVRLWAEDRVARGEEWFSTMFVEVVRKYF